MVEHREVACLDAVQDFRIQRRRGGHAGPRAGREQGDSGRGEPISLPGDFVLSRQRLPYPRIGTAVQMTPHQQIPIDSVSGELVGRQVDALSLQIFVDIAQEIRELKRPAECCGVRCGLLDRRHGAQYRKHLQPDRFGGAAHVEVERVAVRIVGDREIHPHRRQKVIEQLGADLIPADGVGNRGEYGLVAVITAGEKPVSQLLQPFGPDFGAHLRIKVIKDVVGVAGEAVQRVHGRTLVRRQQPGGQKEGTAVRGIEFAAAAIRRRADADRRFRLRPARCGS